MASRADDSCRKVVLVEVRQCVGIAPTNDADDIDWQNIYFSFTFLLFSAKIRLMQMVLQALSEQETAILLQGKKGNAKWLSDMQQLLGQPLTKRGIQHVRRGREKEKAAWGLGQRWRVHTKVLNWNLSQPQSRTRWKRALKLLKWGRECLRKNSNTWKKYVKIWKLRPMMTNKEESAYKK